LTGARGLRYLSGAVVSARRRKVPIPTLDDVVAAAARVAPHLARTPLRPYPLLSRLVGAEVAVKHENHLPTGAFKVRGGVNLVSQLSADERERGIAGASTGNHGLSLAYAAALFRVPATIYVPVGANPAKVQAIRDLGATIVEHGRDFDEARERCEKAAQASGARYVHSGDEPDLISGVGTAHLELVEDWPEVEVVLVPVGGGSGAAGACIAGKGRRGGLTVIGVQSEAAPAAQRSWAARSLVEDRMETAAEGLATRVPFALPQRILWDSLDDFVLVSEEALATCVLTMIEATRTLVEHAGAAALAGALLLRDELAGRRVALVCSGGNITPAQLRAVLERAQ
jgi:threonine dehydratase